MTRYSDRPYHNDVIKGGNTPPPVKDAALGGLEGIRRRLQVASSEDKKISVLRDVLRYGQAGKDLLKQIIKSEAGAVQVAAYCLLNFDSQATEVESQEILGVINAAVQRSIDTRIEVRQISVPATQNDSSSDSSSDSSNELAAGATKIAKLPAIDMPAIGAKSKLKSKPKSRSDRPGQTPHQANRSNYAHQGKEPNKREHNQPAQPTATSTSPAKAPLKPPGQSASDRTPKLPPIQPRPQPQTKQTSHSGYDTQHNGSQNSKSRSPKLSHKHRKDHKKNQNGWQRWFNQTLGISEQTDE